MDFLLGFAGAGLAVVGALALEAGAAGSSFPWLTLLAAAAVLLAAGLKTTGPS